MQPESFFSAAHDVFSETNVLLSGDLLLADNSLEETANENLSVRYRKLALLFAFGGSLGKNPERAVSLFKKSANLGDTESPFYLAMALREGFGVPQNLQESFAWLRISAAKNFAPALYEMAFALQEGIGCQKDPTSASQLFSKAANLKYPKAVSRMLRFSLEKEKIDLKEVLYWINAGKNSVPSSMYACAKELLSRPDPQTHQALYLLEEGAALGDTESQAALAAFWYEGLYCSSNMALALVFAHMAASRGHYLAFQWLENWRNQANDKELSDAAEIASGASSRQIIENLRRKGLTV